MKKPQINIIAAIGEDRELGKDNKLLWHIPEDLEYFNKKTKGHVVIMGSKTFESIGKPLPNRVNIVLNIDPDIKISGCIVAGSLEQALEIAKEKGKGEIFIIGGARVYSETLAIADRLLLTLVSGRYEADVFFPEYSSFKMVKQSPEYNFNKYRFTFTEWIPKE